MLASHDVQSADPVQKNPTKPHDNIIMWKAILQNSFHENCCK